MQETQAIIERVRRINADYQHLELAVADSVGKLKPGQSLLVSLNETWQPYLREQWWPVNVMNNKLVIERPANLRYDPGQVVNVLGPVGQPYRFRRSLRNVLLIAYDSTPTALLMTIPWLLGNQISVTMVLLGSARDYDTQHLPPEVEIIRGDDEMNWQNRVMTVGWADQVFVVVSQNGEHENFTNFWHLFNDLRADIPKNYLFGVFQPILPCGMGACHACMLKMQQGMKLACVEGPSFDLTQVMLGGT
jgi:hypothetical protein